MNTILEALRELNTINFETLNEDLEVILNDKQMYHATEKLDSLISILKSHRIISAKGTPVYLSTQRPKSEKYSMPSPIIRNSDKFKYAVEFDFNDGKNLSAVEVNFSYAGGEHKISLDQVTELARIGGSFNRTSGNQLRDYLNGNVKNSSNKNRIQWIMQLENGHCYLKIALWPNALEIPRKLFFKLYQCCENQNKDFNDEHGFSKSIKNVSEIIAPSNAPNSLKKLDINKFEFYVLNMISYGNKGNERRSFGPQIITHQEIKDPRLEKIARGLDLKNSEELTNILLNKYSERYSFNKLTTDDEGNYYSIPIYLNEEEVEDMLNQFLANEDQITFKFRDGEDKYGKTTKPSILEIKSIDSLYLPMFLNKNESSAQSASPKPINLYELFKKASKGDSIEKDLSQIEKSQGSKFLENIKYLLDFNNLVSFGIHSLYFYPSDLTADNFKIEPIKI